MSNQPTSSEWILLNGIFYKLTRREVTLVTQSTETANPSLWCLLNGKFCMHTVHTVNKCVGCGAARVKRNHVGGNMPVKSNSDETFLSQWKVGLYSGEMTLFFKLSSQHSPVSILLWLLYFYCCFHFRKIHAKVGIVIMQTTWYISHISIRKFPFFPFTTTEK